VPIPETPRADAAAFRASARRARRLDARMRERLGQSLRHVAERAGGRLAVSWSGLDDFLATLARGPVAPLVFGAYYELVLAIEGDELDAAAALLDEIAASGGPEPDLRVSELGDPVRDRAAARWRRLVDTDPSARFAIGPPPPDDARACRREIASAIALLERGDPALAAEIGALVREIVLAAPAGGDGSLDFDGASSFMLWGGTVLNAGNRRTRLEMAQALAHESAHHLLFGLATDGPLVESDGDARHASPLRSDPRPIDGILHATFVLARIHRATRHLLASGALDDAERAGARESMRRCAEGFDAGCDTLRRHARLSPLGAAALAGASAYMARARSRARGAG
jgi:HEXXH motif-containing protein